MRYKKNKVHTSFPKFMKGKDTGNIWLMFHDTGGMLLVKGPGDGTSTEVGDTVFTLDDTYLEDYFEPIVLQTVKE